MHFCLYDRLCREAEGDEKALLNPDEKTEKGRPAPRIESKFESSAQVNLVFHLSTVGVGLI